MTTPPNVVPAEYKTMLDEAAGMDHSATGAVLRCLADILEVHEQSIRANERERIAEGFRQQADRYETTGKTADTLGAQWRGIEQAEHLRHVADCIERGTYEQL